MTKRKSGNWTGLAVFVTIVLLISFGLLVIFKEPKTQNKAKKFFTYPTDYEEYVIKYSEEYDIDPRYIFAVIYAESRFEPEAVSETGARGLMQIMPDAYDWIKFRLDDDRDHSFDDMFDPELNIEYGTYMMSYLYDRFGSYELASAAYHQGMNAVQGWIDDGTIDPEHFNIEEGIEDVPSDVTQDYIYTIMKAYSKYKDNTELEEDINSGKYK